MRHVREREGEREREKERERERLMHYTQRSPPPKCKRYF